MEIPKDQNLTIRSQIKVKISRFFAPDVFSFGLLWLYLLDPAFAAYIFKSYKWLSETPWCNQDPKRIKEFIDKHVKFLDELCLHQLLVSMLDFDPKRRPDFIEIQDIFIYTLNCPFRFFTPINLDKNIEILGCSEFALKNFVLEDTQEINSSLFKYVMAKYDLLSYF